MEGMENNNGVPPIQPVQPKPILKNETPAAIYEAYSNVVLILEKYGWFVILVTIISVFIWRKIEPYWRKWKKKRDKQIEASIEFCPLSSTDLVSVTGAWSLVWGLMAWLQGFASHEGSILSGGWLWKWESLHVIP